MHQAGIRIGKSARLILAKKHACDIDLDFWKYASNQMPSGMKEVQRGREALRIVLIGADELSRGRK